VCTESAINNFRSKAYTIDLDEYKEFNPDLSVNQWNMNWGTFLPDNTFDLIVIDDTRILCSKHDMAIELIKILSKKLKTEFGQLVYKTECGEFTSSPSGSLCNHWIMREIFLCPFDFLTGLNLTDELAGDTKCGYYDDVYGGNTHGVKTMIFEKNQKRRLAKLGLFCISSESILKKMEAVENLEQCTHILSLNRGVK